MQSLFSFIDSSSKSLHLVIGLFGDEWLVTSDEVLTVPFEDTIIESIVRYLKYS